MRLQSFVALDRVVVVRDVEKKLPSFWRYLAKGCAAVEAMETVICGVSRERHFRSRVSVMSRAFITIQQSGRKPGLLAGTGKVGRPEKRIRHNENSHWSLFRR